MKKDKWKIILLDSLRILIGIILLYTSIIKALDPVGTMFALEHKFSMLGIYSQVKAFVFILSFLFIFLEFSIGISLVFKLFIDKTITFSIILFSIYLPLSFITARNEPNYSGLSCNPFALSNIQMFIRNLILLVFSIILFINKKHIKPTKLSERYQLSWLLTSASGIFFVILISYSFSSIIDFSCFHKGTDLNKKIEKYYMNQRLYHNFRVKVLYYNDKTRKFKFFKENNLPWKDTNWVWINTKVIPIRKTTRGLLNNFCIVNSLGRDITDSLLHIREPLLLIVSYDLKRVNIRGLHKAIEFARKFRDKYFPTAYCLTSSSQKIVDSIIELTGAYDIEFCYTNSQFLKSLTRANPSVLILKKGVIIMKRHYNLLPNLKKINFYKINPKHKL